MIRQAFFCVLPVFFSACSSLYDLSEPEQLAAYESGRSVFQTHCAQCHGNDLKGTETGPPLVWDLYVASHHSDRQFRSAIVNGVTQHHWRFGDMPAVVGLSETDVDHVVFFVRMTLREQGIR